MTKQAEEDREEAAKYSDQDVLHLLLTHHARIHDLLERVSTTSGDARRQAFAEVATLLKAHETAEEAVIRPVTEQTAGERVAQARTEEENEADDEIASLLTLNVDSEEFTAGFEKFKQAVPPAGESSPVAAIHTPT